MSFFAPLPPWRPPSDYRAPAWARGPEDMIPGVVPVALLLARTDTHAVLVDGLLVYPTGFDFDLAIRRDPRHPPQHRHRGHLWVDELRLEVRFADGRSADNDPRHWPKTSADEVPDPPLLYQSTSGADGGHVWLWGLPPPGPLVFACQWPGPADPTLAGSARRRAAPGRGPASTDPLARGGLGMSFFAMPAWEPPSGYRIPAWLRPPEAMVPGIVPVELLLARTDTNAVLVTRLRAYPTGLEFILTARPHPDQLQQRRHDPDRLHRLMYRDLWLELRFADGHTSTTDPRRWPRTFETEQPDPPFLYNHGSGGSERGWHSTHWLWGLPPPGPLAFVCRWPAGQLPTSGVEIDASLVLEAADRAVPVWPAG